MSTIGKIAISGPGLKKQGIVVIQAFFIGFFSPLASVLEADLEDFFVPLAVPIPSFCLILSSR